VLKRFSQRPRPISTQHSTAATKTTTATKQPFYSESAQHKNKSAHRLDYTC